MKAIKNVNEMLKMITAESNNWGHDIFDATGVIPIFMKCPGRGIDLSISDYNVLLFSNCGYIELDSEEEYVYRNDVNVTEYCAINNIKDLIEYIRRMEGYTEYLTDTCYGCFKKSDLFWGIWRAIITAPENLLKQGGSSDLEWTLYSISMIDNCLAIQMALNDYDSVQICLDIAKETTLEEFLLSVVREMNNTTADIDYIPKYRLYPDRLRRSPKSYDELYAEIFDFLSWLCNPRDIIM